MKVNVYSVFDSKLAVFELPFFMGTDPAAIRGFTDAVNDSRPENPYLKWNRHPEDYSLYRVGEFDDSIGKLIGINPMSLLTASAIFDFKGSAQLDMFDKNGVSKVSA